MKSIPQLLLFTIGILVSVVAVITGGTVILAALDGYEEHRSAISEGEKGIEITGRLICSASMPRLG